MRAQLYLQTAFDALRTNALRSVLTMIGIIIGIAAIVIIVAVGSGAESLVISQVNSMGSDLVGVLPGNSEDDGPPASAMGVTITTLKLQDAHAIKDRVSGVTAVSGYSKGVATVSWRSQSIDSEFTGVSSEYMNVEATELDRGYFFSEDDDRSLARVAVLGRDAYKNLFGDQDPLGETIKIRQQSFKVIGVLRARGTVAFQNQDDQVFIPISTAHKIMLGIDYLGFIRAKVRSGDDIAAVTEEIRQVLRVEHGLQGAQVDDFSVRSVTQALDVLSTIMGALKFFLAAISALSLLVGGIGIMNIMLVVVLERTREIGLRKALGARPRDLRFQFLLETMVISIAGGLVGLLIGIGISYLIAVIAQSLGYDWAFIISPASYILSVAFPILIGFLFGYYPAQKAANLRPIEALHYE